MIQMLGKLKAAKMATHSAKAIRPDTLAERELLDALLSVTSGHLYRIAPYAYALDLERRGAEIAEDTPEGPTDPMAAPKIEHIRAGLARQFGEGSIELAEIADDVSGTGQALEPGSIQLLEAHSGAVGTAIRREAPACRAVIDAEFALAAARMAVSGIDAMVSESVRSGPLAHRLDAIEDRISMIAERTEIMAGQPVTVPGIDRMLDRLARIESGLTVLLDREPANPAATDPLPGGASATGLTGRLDGLSDQIADLVRQTAALEASSPTGEQVADVLAPMIAQFDARIAQVEAIASRIDAHLTERSVKDG